MHLEVVTPEGSKLKSEVEEITARSVLGELGILSGHIPVLTVLDIGKLQYLCKDTNESKTLALGGGFLEVDGDQLIIITESAEFAEEIDVDRAQSAQQRATQALAELEAGSPAHERKNRSLRRAENRLEVAGS